MSEINILFDGLDIHPLNEELFNKKVFSSVQLKNFNYHVLPRLPPYTDLSRRICLPFNLYPWFNFAYYSKKFLESKKIDLINAHKVIPLNNMPWVIEMENIFFFSYFFDLKQKNFVFRKVDSAMKSLFWKKFNSENCKKIIPWSNYAKRTLEIFFDLNKIKDKIEVVYPGINVNGFTKKKRKEGSEINIGFAAFNFDMKGGNLLLEAYSTLRRKYDIKLSIVSMSPPNLKKEFRECFVGTLPRERLIKEFYPNIDLFVQPTKTDSFGMVFLEAMASKVPVIASNINAVPELIQNHKTGILIDFGKKYLERAFYYPRLYEENIRFLDREKIVNQLIEAISLMVEESSLKRKMGRDAFKEVESGRLSISTRIKKMKKIWEESCA